MSVIRYEKLYTRKLVEEHPSWLWIFGDNVSRTGTGGQAVIRGLKNTYGIPTKVSPGRFEDDYFYDHEGWRDWTPDMKHWIACIPSGWEVYVFPEDGIGTGLAEMKIRCPKLFKSMNEFIEKRKRELVLG